MSLKPLNAATCPQCQSKKTKRGGFSQEHGGSAWKCTPCGREFIVKTLVLRPNP